MAPEVRPDALPMRDALTASANIRNCGARVTSGMFGYAVFSANFNDGINDVFQG